MTPEEYYAAYKNLGYRPTGVRSESGHTEVWRNDRGETTTVQDAETLSKEDRATAIQKFRTRIGADFPLYEGPSRPRH